MDSSKKRRIKIILIILSLSISISYFGYLYLFNAIYSYPLGQATTTIEHAKNVGVFITTYVAEPNYFIVPNSKDTSNVPSIWIQNKFNYKKNILNKTKLVRTKYYYLRIQFLLENFPDLKFVDKISGKQASLADYNDRSYNFVFESVPDSMDIDIYTRHDNIFVQNVRIVRQHNLEKINRP